MFGRNRLSRGGSLRRTGNASSAPPPSSEGDGGEKKVRRKKKPEEAATPAPDAIPGMRKIKKNVAEIDGVMYALDDNGNPTKKLRKKKKPGEENDDEKDKRGRPDRKEGSHSHSHGHDDEKRRLRSRSRPDELRRERSRSRPGGKGGDDGDGGGAEESDQQRPRSRSKPAEDKQQQQRPRSKSRTKENSDEEDNGGGGGGEVRPRTYIDAKGRKVVIEKDGTKSVYDKNGKKLRKKGEKEQRQQQQQQQTKQQEPSPPEKPKPKPEPAKKSTTASALLGDDDSVLGMSTKSGMFDTLWDDENSFAPPGRRKSSASGNNLGGIIEATSAHERGDIDAPQSEARSNAGTSLSAKISEYGKENQELQLKVITMQEELQKISDQNKKEKSKNVKAMTEMMQLKADYTEASSELQQLRSKVKDLSSTIKSKDKEIKNLEAVGEAMIQTAAEQAKAADASNSPRRSSGKYSGMDQKELDRLLTENRALQRKLEFEKATAQNELKKKEDQLTFLQGEMNKLRDDLEMLIRGQKSGARVNPVMVRLLDEKKRLEAQFQQEKEVTSIRIEGLQEMVESLQNVNAELKRKLNPNGESCSSLEIRDLETRQGNLRIAVDEEMAKIDAAAAAAAATTTSSGSAPSLATKMASGLPAWATGSMKGNNNSTNINYDNNNSSASNINNSNNNNNNATTDESKNDGKPDILENNPIVEVWSKWSGMGRK